MKKIIIVLPLIVMIFSITGCATITEGTSQNVSVETSPVTGATCSLQNNDGKWFVNDTPGSVVVHRSSQPIFVSCKKNGYPKASESIQSSTKGMTAGNIVFGGIIGGGVDVADGAAFRYPNDMEVPMKRA